MIHVLLKVLEAAHWRLQKDGYLVRPVPVYWAWTRGMRSFPDCDRITTADLRATAQKGHDWIQKSLDVAGKWVLMPVEA